MQIDGWINADSLRIETDAGSTTITPNIRRPDVPGAGPSPGFSVSLRGARELRYSAEKARRLYDVHLGSFVSRNWNALRTLLSLAPFAVRHGRDLIGYFFRGDAMAGDRLELALDAGIRSNICPTAARGLFGKRDLPEIHEPVSIVVPVFNAHDELLRCLDCLARHTSPRHQVYLVDDASSDTRIRPMLATWARRFGNAQLIENEKNIGFVGSINKALSRAEGHVILLNSDAFVTENWVDRLLAPLATDDRVASVTPMSNAAEILSIPFICEKTPLWPEQARAIDKALSRLDWLKASSEVPTGVGYCMLLNRRWLEVEPRFDPTFGKGYGEEVDWCRKVAARGGVNIGLGGLFIEHKGASSFGMTSVGLKSRHNAIISDRFPKFDMRVQEFRRNDPMIGPRLVASLALLNGGRAVPVFLAHDSGGGAELWLRHEIDRRLALGEGLAVIRSHRSPGAVTLEIHMGDRMVVGQIERWEIGGYLGVLDRIDLIYSCLAMTSAPLELMEICRRSLRSGDTAKVLFHDYFPICPSHNLMGHDGRYCRLPSPEACQDCYARMSRVASDWPADLGVWREEWLRFLQRADRIVTFSNSSRDIVLELWPHLRERLRVEPHAMDWLPASIERKAGSGIVVGVLGSVGYQKGAALLRELARAAEGEFEIVVIGKFDESYSDPGIKVHGPYERDEIADLARRYGVTCWLMPSIWPETFCFAARECLATGLPVIGFDLGAQGEALRAAANGFVLPEDCPLQDVRSRILAVSTANLPTRPHWLDFRVTRRALRARS